MRTLYVLQYTCRAKVTPRSDQPVALTAVKLHLKESASQSVSRKLQNAKNSVGTK